MKAYELMMYMFFVNIAFALYATLGIWSTGFGAVTVDSLVVALQWSLIGTTTVSIGGAIALSKWVPYGPHGAVYVAFIAVYVGIWSYTSKLLDDIVRNTGSAQLVTVFAAVVVITLIVGIYQMVTGGWKGYK